MKAGTGLIFLTCAAIFAYVAFPSAPAFAGLDSPTIDQNVVCASLEEVILKTAAIDAEGGSCVDLMVCNAADMNGDGIDDYSITAECSGKESGAITADKYLVYGRAGADVLSGTISLTANGANVDGVVCDQVGANVLPAFSTSFRSDVEHAGNGFNGPGFDPETAYESVVYGKIASTFSVPSRPAIFALAGLGILGFSRAVWRFKKGG